MANTTVLGLIVQGSGRLFPVSPLRSLSRLCILGSSMRFSFDASIFSASSTRYLVSVWKSSFDSFLRHPFELSSANYLINQKFSATSIFLSSFAMSNCAFTNCASSNSYGGAIYINSTSISTILTDCTFFNCSANYGGSVYGNSIGPASIHRCCFLYSCASIYGSSIEIIQSSNASVEYVTSAFSGALSTSCIEANVIGASTQLSSNMNFSGSSGLSSVSAALFISSSSSICAVRYVTVSSNKISNSVFGMRGSYSVAVDCSNFYNNSYLTGGLFILEGGSGHSISNSVVVNNSGTYLVGYRSEYGVSDLTFANCVFDTVLSSTGDTVITTCCSIVSSASTLYIDNLKSEFCTFHTDIFTNAVRGASSVSFLLASIKFMVSLTQE